MSTQTPTRTRRRAQITRQDVQAIARLVAKRLTEAEACACLGIRPRTWYGWRESHKNQAEYSALLTRVRGQYLRANLAEMEKAAGGKGGVRHDWRAADRLNMIAAPERYQPQLPPQDPPRPPPFAPGVVNIWLKAVYADQPPGGQVVDIPAKQLPETTTPAPEALAIVDGPGREAWNDPAPAPAPPHTSGSLPGWWRKKGGKPPPPA